MADVKISQLTALASASSDVAADVLAIVDTSVPQTKKITIENLVAPITLDKSNSRVGIGTSSPDNLLHIKTTGSTPSIELEQDAGTSYKALFKLAGNDLEIRGSSGAMEFYNGGNNDGDSATLALTIDNSQNATFAGNVTLLGASSYARDLTFAHGATNYYWRMGYTDTSNGNTLAFINRDGSSEQEVMRMDYNKLTTFAGDVNVQSDGARFFVKSSTNELVSIGRAGSSGASLEQGYLRMKAVDSGTLTNKIALHTAGDSYFMGGNIGVGHDSPQFGLTLAQGDTDATAIGWEDGSNNKRASIYCGTSDDSLRFHVNGADRAKILSNGDIELATDETHIHMNTSDGSDNKSWSICGGGGDSTARGAIISLAGNEDGEDGKLRLYAGNASNNGGMIHFHTGNAVHVGKFDYNGDFYSNDGTIHNLSDKRGKKDIQDLSDGLDIVKKLKPVTYKWNGKADMGEDDDVTRYGFVADDVLEVASQYVGTTKAKLDGEDVDNYKTISMLKMFPMLVKAVQELSAKVETLESK